MSAPTRAPSKRAVNKGTPDDVSATTTLPPESAGGGIGAGDFSPFVWNRLGDIQKDLGKLEGQLESVAADCGQIRSVGQIVGRLDADVGGLKQQGARIETSMDSLVTKIDTLTQTTSSSLGFVKGMVWTFGAVFLVIGGIVGWTWSSVIQPGIVQAVTKELRGEIAKQVNDAKLQQTPGKKP